MTDLRFLLAHATAAGEVRAEGAHRRSRVLLTRATFAGLLSALVLGASSAVAHTVWLEPDGQAGRYVVKFGGHQGKTETYPVEKVGEVAAWDARGNKLPVRRVPSTADGDVRIDAAGAALLTVGFDNGYWSKGRDGRSRNVPMSELPGAVSGVHAVKFHKFIGEWSSLVAQPVGQPFELTPLQAEAPRAGEPLRIRVLIDGKPAAGVALAFGEEGRDAVTGDDGVATVTPRAGRNRLWAGQRRAVSGDSRATEHSIEYSLVFDAR